MNFNTFKNNLISWVSYWIKRIFDKTLLQKSLKNTLGMLGVLSCIASITGYIPIKILYPSPKSIEEYIYNTIIILSIFITVFIVVILFNIIIARNNISLVLNGISISIKSGDIFKQPGLKLIPFNDQFDYRIDGARVSPYTLHGKFLSSLSDIQLSDFSEKISSNPHNKNIIHGLGKDVKPYKLGSILLYNDFLLLAFTHTDKENKSVIDINEYEPCLRKMWSEIDRVYGGIKNINLPIVGGGVTRINGKKLNLNQKLECLLCSLERSELQLKTNISIIIYPEDLKYINLLTIKQRFDK